MYIKTNAYDMLVSYDAEEKLVRYTAEMDVQPLLHHLDEIEDDSSWELVEDVDDVEEWLGIDYANSEAPKIVEEISKEL